MLTQLSPLTPSGTPLYQQVKLAILKALAAGEWKQGEAIPPEKPLSERFGVSIGTLRKAIDELTSENILVRHQGRGTFVAAHDHNQHFFRFFRIVRHDGEKTYPTTELLDFRVEAASEEAQEKLGIPAGTRVFRFVNRLSLHQQPVLIDTLTLPETLFQGLTEEQLRERPSTLYRFYQDSFGVNVITIEEHARAALADARHAKRLGISRGAPLLELHRVAYSYNQLPVEWRISRVNTERYEYVGHERSKT